MMNLLRKTVDKRKTWLNVKAFKHEEKIEYREYNYKYIIVLSYFFIALASSIYPFTFAPI